MKIAILTIGDELLNGDLADTNTASIARTLFDHSLPVREACTVGDREEDIVAALQRLASTHDVVLATGGLGRPRMTGPPKRPPGPLNGP